MAARVLLRVVLAIGIVPRASAQKVHVVTGTVFDSVAGVPLAGAIVQVVQLDTALRATSHVVLGVTDGHGHYVIGGLPTGRVAIGFQRDALTALGLESPLRVVAVDGEADIIVDLAIPAGTVVRTRNCDTPANGDGMLTGYVLLGRVVHGEGVPVAAGHLVIPALGVDVPVLNGAATITGLPPGTWVAEARAIGYEPQRAMVDLAASGTASVTLVLGNKVQLLEGIRVVGRPSADYALAAYPDMTGTPVNWRDGRTCAVIAVWTKH